MTKEYIKEAYAKLRKKLGRQFNRDEFFEATNVTTYWILKTFRTFSALVEEMGDTPKSFFKEAKTDDDFMIPYGEMARQLGKIPTNSDWVYYNCKPANTSYIRRYKLRTWNDVKNEFLKYAQNKEEWKDVIALIPEEKISKIQASPKETEECYVYFMLDKKNTFYKIGISNLPEWRERTLQSQKPAIKLIASKKFVNRRIAANIEKALHESYSHKRKRGEWFQLDDEDIEEIKITLSN